MITEVKMNYTTEINQLNQKNDKRLIDLKVLICNCFPIYVINFKKIQ